MPEGATLNISRALLPAGFTLLQVVPALGAGGVETVTVEVAAAAAAAGARSLVASHGGALEGELARRGAKLIRLPVHARDPLSLVANAARLEGIIRREKVNLVHVRSRAPAFSALAAARRARIPAVTTYHGIYTAASPLKRWYNGVMTRGDAVIANSAFTRDHVLAEHGVAATKVVVIPEGVDTTVFDPAAVSPGRLAAVRQAWGIAAGEPRTVILLAARLTGWKGHRLLIDALAGAAGRERARLVFAGPGEGGDYARDLAAQAKRARVDLTIAGPCADMPAAFLAADLVAAPSTLAESFGRAVAEAGATGKVVVAADLGGPAETIEDGVTGLLVPPGDAAAWSAALDRALDMDEVGRTAMGAAARRRIGQRYSLAAMHEATFALYRALTGAP
ncbi:MAG TPA: glycosyltransferase [Caulobacteraceae bacterium]|jgi:glycosyltransferase involved in cell wall biosynthesis|nr:glycosyltransferase [Caulobacteraceae bacterium]